MHGGSHTQTEKHIKETRQIHKVCLAVVVVVVVLVLVLVVVVVVVVVVVIGVVLVAATSVTCSNSRCVMCIFVDKVVKILTGTAFDRYVQLSFGEGGWGDKFGISISFAFGLTGKSRKSRDGEAVCLHGLRRAARALTHRLETCMSCLARVRKGAGCAAEARCKSLVAAL